MSVLASIGRILLRGLYSIPFFILLGTALGFLIAVPAIPRPQVAIIPLSGVIIEQSFTDDILDMLDTARQDSSIKAVVLEIDSPGGYVVTTEAIYLEVLRLRQLKPVVVAIKTTAASGGYYISVAADYIYALPTSEIGSVGAWLILPSPEELDEIVMTTGLFKATGGSRRNAMAELEIIRQEFVSIVQSHRGDRLKLTEDELSQARIYLGTESLKLGLIDEIGTTTDATAKAASLANVRNYIVTKLVREKPDEDGFQFIGIKDLRTQNSLIPVYLYLHFESE